MPRRSILHLAAFPLFEQSHALSCTLDEFGSTRNPNERFFVLAGVAVFERGLYHVIRAADDCVDSFGLGDPHAIELHGNAMYAGRELASGAR